MKTTRLMAYGVVLTIAMVNVGFVNSSQAAAPIVRQSIPLPPVYISDNTFLPGDWTVTAEATVGAAYTITQQIDGGFGGGPFRFMSHRLPPVSGSELATVTVTHVHTASIYNPGVEGPITAIDYWEAGIILSFPFPESFSTTQPVVVQGGRIYRSPEFIRFIAQNSSHHWGVRTLDQLTAADFLAVDGSGDHPDFSANGGPIRFGFSRTNSRSSTLPPVPGDQDMVIEQGVDNWRISIYREALPPRAVDDVFILNGYRRSLPLLELFDVVENDSGYDLEITEVTEPIYGSAGSISNHTIGYELGEARASDSFGYTISDGSLTSSAQVDIHIDCACTVLCLNQLEPPEFSLASREGADNIDLPLIYRVRDFILKTTLDGRRYVDMYYTSNPEILVNILANESLRSEALATVELWQDNLRSLAYGDGSAVITQAQMDALSSFLTHLSGVSSTELQQLIAVERARLGPLDDFVGLDMKKAKHRAIGDATLYLPLTRADP